MEELFDTQPLVNEMIGAGATLDEILKEIELQSGVEGIAESTVLSALVSKAIDENLVYGKVTIWGGNPTVIQGTTGTWVGR